MINPLLDLSYKRGTMAFSHNTSLFRGYPILVYKTVISTGNALALILPMAFATATTARGHSHLAHRFADEVVTAVR